MNIAHTLTETISRKAVSSRSDHGDPTYASATTFAARVERTNGVTYGPGGASVAYSHRVFCQTAVALSDLLFFSEDSTSDNSTGKRPVSVTTCRRLNGVVSHYEVLI